MVIQGRIPGTDSLINIVVQNGKVVQVDPCLKGSSCDFGGTELYLCPGFFDPQANGFAGVDFNNLGLTPGGLHRAAHSLASTGVTHFFPTLITSSHEKMVHQLKVITNALKNDLLLQRMCLGIHLEGPYLSPEDGPRGIHPLEFIRPPRWEELEEFQEVCEGRIKCVTLAPEVEGAMPFIEKAVVHGIAIGIGHTHASGEVIEEAVRTGASFSCHLGNAPSAISPQYQDLIQKQLTMDQLMACIIVDGIHLPHDLVKHYILTKGIDRIILTTDCMAAAVNFPGRFTLGDLEVEVDEDGIARLVGHPRLAGSTLTMDRAITNVIRFAGIDLASAIQMAGKNAQKLFPDLMGEIIPGEDADLILFEYQEEVVVRSTWIQGEKIF